MTDFVNIERRSQDGLTYYTLKCDSGVIEIEGMRGDWYARHWQGLPLHLINNLRNKALAAGVRLSEVSDLFKSAHDDKPFNDYPICEEIATGKTLKELDLKLTHELVGKIEADGLELYHKLMAENWGREVPQRTTLKMDFTLHFGREEYRNVLDYCDYMYSDTSEECVKQWLEAEMQNFIQGKLEKLESRKAFFDWKRQQAEKVGA
jgi:hypothetical protein